MKTQVWSSCLVCSKRWKNSLKKKHRSSLGENREKLTAHARMRRTRILNFLRVWLTWMQLYCTSSLVQSFKLLGVKYHFRFTHFCLFLWCCWKVLPISIMLVPLCIKTVKSNGLWTICPREFMQIRTVLDIQVSKRARLVFDHNSVSVRFHPEKTFYQLLCVLLAVDWSKWSEFCFGWVEKLRHDKTNTAMHTNRSFKHAYS